MTRSKRVTSRDVAEEAGVSRATVSYVLNEVADQRVSPATRARVRDVALRLGYTPDPAARALRDGQTELVLIANPPWTLSPVVAAGVTAAVEHLETRGYTPLLAIGRAATRDYLIRACQRSHPRGIIGPGAELNTAAVRMIRASGTQVILAIDRQPLRHIPTMVVDQPGFGRIALSYLRDQGHRRVLAVLPDDPAAERTTAEDRLHGAREVAEESGIRLDEARVGRDLTVPAALEQAFADAAHAPTAIYSYNDEHAMAVIGALADRGVRVPDDVAVIGCDDIPPAQHFRPALTTVRLDAVALYIATAQALVELMEGREPDIGAMAEDVRAGMMRIVIRQSA